jgi:threonine/homoserine/homoserine lactone efflux protein
MIDAGFKERANYMFSSLIPGITYGFAAAVTPGPLSMYLISQSISAGWRRALPVAFSPLISDGPVALLVLAVLSQVPSNVVQYLRIPGGLFIFYLAFGAWKTWRGFDSGIADPAPSGSSNLWKSTIVNWLNPNMYLGWSIILGPIVLSAWHKSPAIGIGLLLGFYVTMIVTMIGMIILFAAAGTFGPKVRKSLIGLSSIGLAFLGIYQLWLGISALHAASQLISPVGLWAMPPAALSKGGIG